MGSKGGSDSNLIAAGNTYQVNLTGEASGEAQGGAADLFEAMMAAQPVEYRALVNLGGLLILSVSPELFFRKQGRHITVRPMKGTAPRGKSPSEDERSALTEEPFGLPELLAADEIQVCNAVRGMRLGSLAPGGPMLS